MEIDPVQTYSTILSKPANRWGAETGSNEKGVSIGITYTENEPTDGCLLATDLTRLGLERSASASEAIDIISSLSSESGPQGESRESSKYCFVVCDPNEAWLLNIVGNLWAAEKITTGFRSISVGLSVRTIVDKSYPDIQQKSQTLGFWAGNGDFNFSEIFSAIPAKAIGWPPGTEPADVEANFSVTDMFSVLRAQAAISQARTSHVSTLSPSGVSCHWFTGTPDPNESVFKPFVFTLNARISNYTRIADDDDKTVLEKFHEKRRWNLVGDLLKSLEASCVEEVQTFLSEHSEPNSELDELMKDCVEAEIKFYR